MSGQIIRQAEQSQDRVIENVKLATFVSPQKLSEIREEYEQLQKKIEELRQLQEAEGRKEGYQVGFDKGQEEGFQKGEADGYAAGLSKGREEVREEEGDALRLFLRLIEDLRDKRLVYIQKSDHLITDLIIEISKHVLSAIAKLKPETILTITQKAIEKLAYCPNVLLHINPRDFETLERNREQLEAILSGVSNLQIEENPSIIPGSCRLETHSGVIDADFIAQLDGVKSLLYKHMMPVADSPEWQESTAEPAENATEEPVDSPDDPTSEDPPSNVQDEPEPDETSEEPAPPAEAEVAPDDPEISEAEDPESTPPPDDDTN